MVHAISDCTRTVAQAARGRTGSASGLVLLSGKVRIRVLAERHDPRESGRSATEIARRKDSLSRGTLVSGWGCVLQHQIEEL